MTHETYTIEQVAEILGCESEKAVEKITIGDLPGLKWGRGWIVPREAFNQRLNELALQEAQERRKAREATVAGKVITAAQDTTGKSRRQARTPPVLPRAF